MRISKEERFGAWSIFNLILLVVIQASIAQECGTDLNGKLVIAENGTISLAHSSNLDERETLVTGIETCMSIAYSYSENILYYSDLKTRHVFGLGEKSDKPVIAIPDQGNWLPSGIAVDDVNGKIYVTNGFDGTVNLFDPKNPVRQIVVSNLTAPRRVAVDAKQGYLFIQDEMQVLRTDLNGANPRVIHNYFASLGGIVSLALDKVPGLNSILGYLSSRFPLWKEFQLPASIGDIFVDTRAKRIYWVDFLYRKIESANYNGRGKEVHYAGDFRDSLPDSFSNSLTVLDGQLYWADGPSKKIVKIYLNRKNAVEEIPTKFEIQQFKAISC